MDRTPNPATLRDSLPANPRMMRRAWLKYPGRLDGFAAEAERMLHGPWDQSTDERRLFLADVMDQAKNPNLARLLREESFPALRDALLDEAGTATTALPNDTSLLKAFGVWTLRRSNGTPGPRRVLELAQALRRNGQADLARRLLLHRLWRDRQNLPEVFRELRDELALCTSMASDLAPGPRLEEALDLLHVRGPKAGKSGSKKAKDFSKEAQGLRYRGWIYRRRWEFYHRRRDLKLAARLYASAAKLARDPLDRLKSTADAAYHLDLMAQLDGQMGSREDARQARARADDLRLRALKEAAPEPGQMEPAAQIAGQPLQLYRWLHNVAQLQLGLQEWEKEQVEAADSEDAPAAAEDLAWFQSLPNPLRHLIRARKISGLPAWIKSRKVQEIAERSKVWGVGERYVQALLEKSKKAGDRAEIGRSISKGKLGLGLSGGGFRASLFHLGVLASLAEWDLLQQVEVISSVSGGSIVGAHFYLKLRHLLETRNDAEISRDDYVELVRELIHEFLAGVQKNVRTRVVASPWANLRMLLTHYTRSARAGDLLDRHLFRRIADGRADGSTQGPRLLSDLRIDPPLDSDQSSFNPVRDNWKRQHKVPILILNATSLNTGHCWQFGATWMGESPAAVDPKVDSNDRLRRMDIGREAPPPHDTLRLGHAVAASACVPGLFEPSTLPQLYKKKLVRLVDGGVFDNQGVAGLLEQECRIVLVSDASGQMSAQDQPRGGFLGSTMRSNTILMDRVRQTQFRDLRARRQSGQLDGLSYVHLKQDLEAGTVDWLGCDDPKPAMTSGEVPGYGIPKPTQALLAGIRTDLDSFCDTEAYALMYSGYRMMTAECKRLSLSRSELISAETKVDDERAESGAAVGVDWPFLCVEDRLTDEATSDSRFASILEVGGQGAFKIWRLWRRGRPAAKWTAGAAALLPLAWLAWLYASWLIRVDPQATLGVSQILLALLPLAAAALLLVPPLRALLARLTRLLVFGVLGMAAAWIHLVVFDPLYLRYGREPAGFARRLLYEASREAAQGRAKKAQRKARRALAILRRVSAPSTPGEKAGHDSPWLSQVGLARALAILGDHRQAASRLREVADRLETAAAAMTEQAEQRGDRTRCRRRQEKLLRRRAYVEHLASQLGEGGADAATAVDQATAG